ncbi:MAG: hypothetical protein A4E29_00106 [Methanomassiliicoccales archaeon PtaB.Bin134]|jgi:Kef-type K+ transport system membrane component KefB|nr:MAG: hypothetical protein A4E29_00106 [Methanomassiliicoccales archaeon PtaB.Bin134]
MDKENNIEMARVAFITTEVIIFIIGLLLVLETYLELNLSVVCGMAVILLSTNMLYHVGRGAKDRKERLARVGNEAMSLSWFVTLVVILLSLALTGGLDIGLTTGQILGIGLMAMISTMIGHNEIMARRGVTAGAWTWSGQ